MKTVENPFFSIIIPCYNSKKTISRLLSSIASQGMSDEIEVILSDDHSTESYDNEVEPFYNQLCIKRITTDYNCCPGNTREKGASIATGKWLVFADHDDMFLPRAFKTVKKQIELKKEEYVAYCNIYRCRNSTSSRFDESMVEIEMHNFTELLHGKFFNKENLWDKYDIHFKKDMFTHEDTYVITCIKCVLKHLDREPFHIDIFDYVWFNNSKSLSNSTGLMNFLEEHFHYFIEATSDVYREYHAKGLVDDSFTLYNLVRMFLNEYFYMQKFLFQKPESYRKENANFCRDELVKIKKMFNMTNVDIFWYCGQSNAALFSSVLRESGFGFIPNHSLMQWMEMLDTDNKQGGNV